MTKEEITEMYSMRDIVEQNGFHLNRKGFMKCPFHHDKGPSFKVYNKDFHCFGCGAHGDIFNFIQLLNGVDFKEAFQSLGGTYEKPTFESKLAIYRAKKKRKTLRLKAEKEKAKRDINNDLITLYRHQIEASEPMSDAWCDGINALQKEMYKHDILNGWEVS